MKCTLMNKNTPVLSVEYDTPTGVFTQIYEVHNILYAPYNLKIIYLSKEKYQPGRIN